MVEFWLKNETAGIDLLLPITPEGFEISNGKEIEKVRATELGDINVVGRRKPKNIILQSFFPENKYDFTVAGGVSANTAMDYVKLIEGWVQNSDIIRVVIADEKGAKVNEQFYIEEILYGQKREDNGDIPYSISFQQYTPMKITPVTPTATENTKRADASTASPTKPKSYTVKKGDCLSAIARSVYGDASQWKKIYEANKGIIGKNPNLIFPGQTYTIP